MKRATLYVLSGVLSFLGFACLTGCDLLDPPVPPIETFSTGELVEELVSRGFEELGDLFEDGD